MKQIYLVFLLSIVLVALTFSQLADAQSTMKICGMMNKSPNDVTIRSASSQLVQAGQEATVKLLIKDKANKPLLAAQVLIVVERGAPMSTMDMVDPMSYAKEIGFGKYQVTFTPDTKGIYTIHTHVIPDGKPMMAMMQNHMDIGIIAK